MKADDATEPGKGSDAALDETLPSDDRASAPGSGSGLAYTLQTGPIVIANLTIDRGTPIGRYMVIDRIGSGTMGLVIAAFDPTLDRKVAIKLVRPDPSGESVGRQRLVREAQAMAKLSHPNVVTVFEVGTFAEHVFLAMEYVSGGSLAQWLATKPARRDIVAAFVAAGHGLAAAHRAGIVHRDFKPANVLIDGDRRVRVADFGLATAPGADSIRPRDSAPIATDIAMTQTGTVLGTPAYMAPEQHRGEAADARADQFAFCVALYEALYGELPFTGDTYAAYREQVLAGSVREARRGVDVPARLRRALLRGLAATADARYPDMDALLADLARDPATQRRRVIVGGAIVLAAAALLAVNLAGHAKDDPCANASQAVAAVWNDQARTGIQHAFAATGAPMQAETFTRVATGFDGYFGDLSRGRRDACEATAVRHEQSAELLDRRIQCLDTRLAEASGLVSVLTDHADRVVVGRATDAVLALTPIADCSDRAALLRSAALPPAMLRPLVDTLRHRIASIAALVDAGMWSTASSQLTELMPQVDGVDYVPLRARAHHLAAEIDLNVGKFEASAAELHRAIELASAAHDDDIAAQTWVGLYALLGGKLHKLDLAGEVEVGARAAVARVGDDPYLRAQLATARGVVAMGRGDAAAAVTLFEAAVHEHERGGASDRGGVANALANEASALTDAGDFRGARAALDRALAIRVAAPGPRPLRRRRSSLSARRLARRYR